MSKELAIIIDCWESSNTHNSSLLSHNIIDYIHQREEIKYVVLASYDVYYDDDDNTVWRDNYNKMFFDNAFLTTRYLYNLADSSRKLDQHKKGFTLERTDPVLLNTVFYEKFQISLRHFFELDYILKQDPEIETIWVLGSGWEKCLKHRELGWEYLKQLTKKNILTISSCINPFLYKVNNNPNWESTELGDFIYRHK